MPKEWLYKLCDELRMYLEKQRTQFRDPIYVKKQVACTLYYLVDEGTLREAANAFGIVWNCLECVCNKFLYQINIKKTKTLV